MAERPVDPMMEAVRRAAASGMPRRRVLEAAALGSAAVAGSSLLAACGTKGSGGGDATSAAPTTPDKSDTDKTLNFSNWQLYIDVDDKDANKRPTLDEFKAKTGVTVAYTEDINDNDSFYAKIAPALRAGQDTGKDIFALTDWMAARLIRQGYVQKVDKANLPNVDKNLIDSLKAPTWDPQRDHSAPWQSGVTGIAYNAKKVPEVKSIEELLTRADLKGHVTVLTEWRDTIGLILLQQGKDPANFTDDDFMNAVDYLQKANDSGQIRQFTGNDYSGLLADGTAYACMAWSGDVVQLQADNPDIKFVQPESGMMIWADNMMIPNMAQHKKNAELLMNFYYDPAIAAQLTAYVQYISPVKGTQAAMEKVDPTLVDNQLIFPDEAFLSKTHLFMGVEEATEKKYAAAFNKVKGS
ncbi:MAG TPA: spermidine/putrescine ABC transporter substrate-binding protein [Candidatus Nanopelagicales bacterium]|nr:spermidine/putrescine ABC transporter substrate-binding protein [Candidatus Nanopelagicales bacterium]